MYLYPYFCYEKGCASLKNHIAFSIQSAMTSVGRVCLVVLADACESETEGEYAADLAVKRVTSWFWEKGAFLSARDYTKGSVCRSLLRELYHLNDELISRGKERNTHFILEMKVLMIKDKYYYAWDMGNVSAVMVKESRKRRRIKHMNKKYADMKSIFGEISVLPKIRFSHRKFKKETTFFIFSKTMDQFWTSERILSLLPTKKKHEKLKVRMEEVAKRMKAKHMKDDYCCICLVTETE